MKRHKARKAVKHQTPRTSQAPTTPEPADDQNENDASDNQGNHNDDQGENNDEQGDQNNDEGENKSAQVDTGQGED